MYGWRERGFLPAEGGVLDQSRIFLQACSFIDEQLAERREKKK